MLRFDFCYTTHELASQYFALSTLAKKRTSCVKPSLAKVEFAPFPFKAPSLAEGVWGWVVIARFCVAKSWQSIKNSDFA